VWDLEAVLDEVQEALTWAEAPVRHDGGYLSLAERVRWLHLRGRDRHRERDEARAEVRKLRAERAVMLDVIEAADEYATWGGKENRKILFDALARARDLARRRT
jgi:hypothetical protein